MCVVDCLFPKHNEYNNNNNCVCVYNQKLMILSILLSGWRYALWSMPGDSSLCFQCNQTSFGNDQVLLTSFVVQNFESVGFIIIVLRIPGQSQGVQ